jgi:hypothetical protein
MGVWGHSAAAQLLPLAAAAAVAGIGAPGHDSQWHHPTYHHLSAGQPQRNKGLLLLLLVTQGMAASGTTLPTPLFCTVWSQTNGRPFALTVTAFYTGAHPKSLL